MGGNKNSQFKLKIKITNEVKDAIQKIGNKTFQESAMKIYTALYLLHQKRKDKNGWFEVPSAYLLSINKRYSTILKAFIEANIIEFYERIWIDEKDIYNTYIKKSKSYSSTYGYCMRYRFIIKFNDAESIHVDFNSNKQKRWYSIIASSLQSFGYKPDIKRDSFGRRVHYSLIKTYKEDLKDKGLFVIDSKTSQPRLLWMIMKKHGIYDKDYFEIFENEIDFYNSIASSLYLTNRNEAKDLFMHWLNGKPSVSNTINNLFPVATQYLNSIKSKNYKDSSSLFQREEARIWIDDLLNNVPTDFCLSVHDSLIVKKEDVELVKGYCKSKYPDLRFDINPL